MSVTGSCGHDITNEPNEEFGGWGINISVKEQDRDGSNCIHHLVVCKKCFELHKGWGDIIETEEEKQAWLDGKSQRYDMESIRKMTFNSSLEEYYDLIRKRNRETAEDGHEPFFGVFNYEDSLIESRLPYWKECWEHGLSPYKALTFFRAELPDDPEIFIDGNRLLAVFDGFVLEGDEKYRDRSGANKTVRDKDDFYYHESWDWLMPLLHKIVDLNKYKNKNLWEQIANFYLPSFDIKGCWTVAVRYIRWYNEQVELDRTK